MNIVEGWVKFKASPEFGLDFLDNGVTGKWGPDKREKGVVHSPTHITHLLCINIWAIITWAIPSVFFQVKVKLCKFKVDLIYILDMPEFTQCGRNS